MAKKKEEVQEIEQNQELIQGEEFEQNGEPTIEESPIVEQPIEEVQEIEQSEVIQNVAENANLNDIKKIKLTCDVMYNGKKINKGTILELDKEELKKFPKTFYLSNCD